MDDYFFGKWIEKQFSKLAKQGDKIMAALDDLKQGLTDLGTSMANVEQDVKNLQAQIAAGGTITEAQLQPFADQAKAMAAAMKTLADSVPDAAPQP